jgi:hypothetical protein
VLWGLLRHYYHVCRRGNWRSSQIFLGAKPG